MTLLLSILAILIFSYLITKFSSRVSIPPVVALIITGLIFNISFLKDIFISGNQEFLFILGDIGLVSLMFLAGLDTSWKKFQKEEKDSLAIAIFTSLIPLTTGFILMRLIGFSLVESIIIGIGMAITAEATKAKVLRDLKIIKSKVGSAMMGAGIIDDLIGLFLFVLIVFVFANSIYFREVILVLSSVFAFFSGLALQKLLGRNHRKITSFENSIYILIVPFFFISMGMHFEITSLLINPYLLAVILFIAFTGKMFGALMTKPWTSLSYKQLKLIGWGMNSRGALELALAVVAFRSMLIPIEAYSALVVTAFTTTIIFPFVITKMIRKDPQIMDK